MSSSLIAYVQPPRALDAGTRAGVALLWFTNTLATGTTLGLASHLAGSGAASEKSLAIALQAGYLAVAMLGLALLLLATMGALVPAMRARSLHVGALLTGILVTGLPWTFICAIAAPYFGVVDFWVPAGAGSLVAFILWLRVVLESFRGAAALWARLELRGFGAYAAGVSKAVVVK